MLLVIQKIFAHRHFEYFSYVRTIFSLLPFSFDAVSKYKGIFYLVTIFHEEITKQISIMKNLDLVIDHNGGNTVRDVLRIPNSLKDILPGYEK
ncbi:hypothetical protein Glove_136g134 [Diversispora epigaea]|uniref:Uncharacterized protein n=1 Tax=Diversispora epigaea TaxID=1348612 RepID=A0A397J349_9GLOM|nr:hypothetical protein Glove_136g134 [Diversispora epigaea]